MSFIFLVGFLKYFLEILCIIDINEVVKVDVELEILEWVFFMLFFVFHSFPFIFMCKKFQNMASRPCFRRSDNAWRNVSCNPTLAVTPAS